MRHRALGTALEHPVPKKISADESRTPFSVRSGFAIFVQKRERERERIFGGTLLRMEEQSRSVEARQRRDKKDSSHLYLESRPRKVTVLAVGPFFTTALFSFSFFDSFPYLKSFLNFIQ